MLRLAILSAAIGLIALAGAPQADADVFVRGYYRANGTYVQPHYRSDPDGNVYNNWSTYGNTNPYTGAIGTRRVLDYYTPTYYQQPAARTYTPSYYNGYYWSR